MRVDLFGVDGDGNQVGKPLKSLLFGKDCGMKHWNSQ
jgi:hypothetical protein